MRLRDPCLSCSLLVFLSACSSGGTPGPAVPDSGIVTGACTGDASLCLGGKVTSTQFAVRLASAQIELHRVFPGGVAAPIAVQPLGSDGNWAFGGLAPWDHYYLRVVGTFDAQTGITRVVGPLSVPSDAGSLTIDLQPVRVEVIETRAPGGAMQFVQASARVFDPATGFEIGDGGATVTIAVGDASVPLLWASQNNFGYSAQPLLPLPAQPAYTVSVMSSPDASPTLWSLQADPPDFDGTILTLGSGAPDAAIDATVFTQAPLTPQWTPPPATSPQTTVDYVQVELFESQDAGYLLRYQSPAPDSPDTTQETVAGAYLPDPAPYLLDVAYTKADCALGASGCVHASTVAVQTFDASPGDASGE